MRSILAVLILSVGLAACAGIGGAPETPAQRVFAAKTDYGAVRALALNYESLPRCSETQSDPCSETDIVAEIRSADLVALEALDRAEAIVRNPESTADAAATAATAARAAVDVFEAVIDNYDIH